MCCIHTYMAILLASNVFQFCSTLSSIELCLFPLFMLNRVEWVSRVDLTWTLDTSPYGDNHFNL